MPKTAWLAFMNSNAFWHGVGLLSKPGCGFCQYLAFFA
jgi:hypothetical protein